MKGTYCLLVELKKTSKIKTGSLGSLLFERGYYVYVGSALNGLERRIARHLRREKRKHWHVDYLLSNGNARVRRVFAKQTSDREECRIAEKVSACGEPVKNFGCSDCRCRSHLFKVNKAVFLAESGKIGLRVYALRRGFPAHKK